MRCLGISLVVLSLVTGIAGASKPHVVSFAAPVQAKLLVGPSEDKTLNITVRALYVDAKLKEFTTGERHDVTDRLFVVRRAFRINDSLPDDPKQHPRWLWQRGGWLLVDRTSGKILPIRLPDFDPFYSDVSWYRDYASFCGIADSGEGLYAIVAQIGNRKPLYRKAIGSASGGDLPDADCGQPHWDRQPARVTFLPKRGEKLTVNVTGRFADTLPDTSPEEPDTK